FVRKDGTICTKPGYDPDSKMFLYPSEDLKEVSVPEKPTKKQVQEARAVVEDWLVDFRENVPSDADRANMIGLALTPFVRLLRPQGRDHLHQAGVRPGFQDVPLSFGGPEGGLGSGEADQEAGPGSPCRG